MEYELAIHPNWGISRPNVVRFTDRSVAMAAFDETDLGGVGGVIRVTLKEDGRTIAEKTEAE